MSSIQPQAFEILELGVQNFKAEVIDDPSPILIDFWAPWCMPCRILKPLFHEAAVLLKEEVRAAQVNVDQEPQLSEAFGIRGIPTLLLVKGGQVVDAWSGVMPVGEIAARVRKHLPGGQ